MAMRVALVNQLNGADYRKARIIKRIKRIRQKIGRIRKAVTSALSLA